MPVRAGPGRRLKVQGDCCSSGTPSLHTARTFQTSFSWQISFQDGKQMQPDRVATLRHRFRTLITHRRQASCLRATRHPCRKRGPELSQLQLGGENFTKKPPDTFHIPLPGDFVKPLWGQVDDFRIRWRNSAARLLRPVRDPRGALSESAHCQCGQRRRLL